MIIAKFLRNNLLTAALIAACFALTLTYAHATRALPNSVQTAPALAVGIETRAPIPDVGREVLARTIAFSETKEPIKFAAALQTVADAAHFNLHVNWKALEAAGFQPDEPISLRSTLQGVSARTALSAIINAVSPDAPVGFEYWEDAILVSTHEDLDKHTVTVIYNVRDVIEAYIQYEGVSVRQEAMERLVQLITDTVAPDSWRDAGGSVGSMRAIMGLLVVMQTPSNQNLVSDELTAIRQSSRAIAPAEAKIHP